MTYTHSPMKNHPRPLLIAVSLAIATQVWSHSLLAAEPADAPNPWDVGLIVGFEQSPFAGGEHRMSVSPTRLQHGGLRLNGLAWPVYQHDAFKFYLGAGLDDWSYERDDSPQLQDMDKLERAINLRAGIATALAGGWATAEVAKDLAGAHEGMQAKLRYTTSIGSEEHELRPYAELQWLSGDMADYYVGVDANEVVAGRAQYTADDAFAIKAGVDYRHPLSESFTIIGGLHLTSYGDEISNSPIVENDLIWGANVGLAYRWK